MKWLQRWMRIKKNKSAASVFIDYEYWYATYLEMYHKKPDLVQLRKRLEERYSIKEILVFADFSKDKMQSELEKLETTANNVINTFQKAIKQNMCVTETCMLDYIYQYEMENPHTNCYLLFSNSECFCRVIRFLQKRRKDVLVLGVRNTLSFFQKNGVCKTIEIPLVEEIRNKYFGMIVRNMEYALECPTIIPTFRTTVKAVAKYNKESEYKIHIALEEMIKQGLIIQREWNIEPGRTIKVLDTDWDKVNAAGLN